MVERKYIHIDVRVFIRTSGLLDSLTVSPRSDGCAHFAPKLPYRAAFTENAPWNCTDCTPYYISNYTLSLTDSTLSSQMIANTWQLQTFSSIAIYWR